MFRTTLISMFLTSAALADTWTVDDDGKADFDNIQAAVDASSDGDEIIVMPGTYTSTAYEVVDMRGKEIWIHSSGGAEVTIIDGEETRRGITCVNGETLNTVIEGFTITNGYNLGYGGGMFNNYYSNPTLSDIIFCGNETCQIFGPWTNAGGICFAFSCEDIDGNGWPDECVSVDDGVHQVPEEFATVQEAIEFAGDGDEIIIGPGTYTGHGDWVINPNGKHLWIHSSDGPEVTIIDGEDERRCIVCVNGESSKTVIDGLTITNGYGAYVPFSGVCCTSSQCIITMPERCYGFFLGVTSICSPNPCLSLASLSTSNDVDFNFAIDSVYIGGGMYCIWSNPTISNCVFINNRGALYNDNSSTMVINCTLTGNSAGQNIAGGVSSTFSDKGPILTDSIICGNSNGQVRGSWFDGGGNLIADECPECPDINGDGLVNVTDLLAVIDQWGLTDSPADVNDDGIVDVSDLLIVIDNWGPCE